jgi:hypothetical protein
MFGSKGPSMNTSSLVPPPPVSGGRARRGTLAGEKGVGRVPIPTRGIHCGTLYMYVLCVLTLNVCPQPRPPATISCLVLGCTPPSLPAHNPHPTSVSWISLNAFRSKTRKHNEGLGDLKWSCYLTPTLPIPPPPPTPVDWP